MAPRSRAGLRSCARMRPALKAPSLAPLYADVSLASLHQLAQDTLARFALEAAPAGSLLRVPGTLASLGVARGRTHFGAELADDGVRVGLILPARLVESLRLQVGEQVRVVGRLNAHFSQRGEASLRLAVSGVERDGAVATESLASGTVSLGQLKALFARHPFPVLNGRTRLAVVHAAGSQAQVPSDFLAEIAPLGAVVHVARVAVSLSDAGAIAQAIAGVEADILALIRGGGPDSDFLVFDDRRVVEAFAAFPGYRVTGLGHSGNTTALDLIADHAARKPVPLWPLRYARKCAGSVSDALPDQVGKPGCSAGWRDCGAGSVRQRTCLSGDAAPL